MSVDYKKPETLDELYVQMKNDERNLPRWDSLPLFNEEAPDIENTNQVWSWDDTRKIVGSCSYDITIEKRDDLWGFPLPETLDELYVQMKNDDPNLKMGFPLPLFNEETPDIKNTNGILSWDDTRKIVGSCPGDITIEKRDDL